jgi:hypothetical protein
MQKLHPQLVEAPMTIPNNCGSPVRIDPGFPVSIVPSLRDRIDQKARNLPERFRASV